MRATWNAKFRLVAVAIGVTVAGLLTAGAGEWHHWRGPSQNGVSPETGLVSSWSPEGENLIWRADFIGRSTPVIFDGRVCAIGRTGQDITKQEMVACWNAETGKKLWEHKFKVFHTTIPFTRVGWPNVSADPATGNLYAQGVGGLLFGFDRRGKILWSRSLTEQFGRFSGYGGRTHSPIVDEDRVVLGMTAVAWGGHTVPRHRYYAFDKKNGELLWISDPAGPAKTKTTYSTPVVTVIGGRRLLIGGNSDGAVYALQSRTGKMVWKFELAKLGLNTSVAVDGDRVFASTGDEPVDEAIMGRVVAIDATGSGDVTSSHELWRVSGLKAKYASPLVHEGVVYIQDDSANLHALEADTGTELWVENFGTVGRGSPVWGDGKIFLTEVNGNFHIIKPRADGADALDHDRLTVESENGKRHAEIFGSPAIAYGRVYFTAESGVYCLGDPDAEFRATPGPERELAPEGAPGDVAMIQVVPAEVLLTPGKTARFKIRAFDAGGRQVRAPQGVAWMLDGVQGNMSPTGKFTPSGPAAGTVVARTPTLTAAARVRVVPSLPFDEDFTSVPVDKNPPYWVGAGSRFKVTTLDDGNSVLSKPYVGRGLERQIAFMGASDLTGYTVQADLMGTKKGRRMPDMGLVAERYILDLQGNHQRLEIRDWAELRFMERIEFPWEPDVWYRMKFQIESDENRALVRGKVWRADQPEPDGWTISGEDPLPNREGSPGLYGYSPTTIYYDNVKVW